MNHPRLNWREYNERGEQKSTQAEDDPRAQETRRNI
jgi:hypothetical protein